MGRSKGVFIILFYLVYSSTGNNWYIQVQVIIGIFKVQFLSAANTNVLVSCLQELQNGHVATFIPLAKMLLPLVKGG